MKTVTYRGRTFQVPENIDELTPGQYRRYLEISLMNDRGFISKTGLRCKLLTLLLGERTDISFLSEPIFKEAMDHIGLVFPFILGGKIHDSLTLYTGANLLKEWDGWKGPGDMLDGVKFGDFIDCNSLMRLISKGGSATESERLVSEFCQKLYKNDNPKAVPDEILCAHSLILFNNVMKAIREEPVEINGEPVNFSILFDKSGKERPDDHTGWTGAALEIAETGTFGNYRQVLDTPLWDILLFLYRKKFEHLYAKI